MQSDYTHISFVLDRSGSMGHIARETIASFNKFIEEQRNFPGRATLSLNLFDDTVDVVHNFTPLEQVEALTPNIYYTRGSTALRDAIGRTIKETGATLAAMPESARPAKVLLVIFTDGYENASHEYTQSQIADMIKHQEEVYAWQVVYMGANQDAVLVGGGMNVGALNSYNAQATPEGIQKTMGDLSASTISYRSMSAPRTDNFYGSLTPPDTGKVPA